MAVAVLALTADGLYVRLRGPSASAKAASFKPVSATTPTPVTQPTVFDPAVLVNRDKASVVKVTGSGCGLVFAGTGFVVAPGLVATNAHVIAGTDAPQVIDGQGAHPAVPVLYDTKLDFAVLRVGGLDDAPLPLDSAAANVTVAGLHNGDHDEMLGYPGGGVFGSGPAVISDEFEADINDIYGNPNDDQDIYVLNADVVEGDSGSPVIQQNGLVAAIVFARSPNEAGKGFAVPTSQFIGEVRQAQSLYTAVDSSKCLND